MEGYHLIQDSSGQFQLMLKVWLGIHTLSTHLWYVYPLSSSSYVQLLVPDAWHKVFCIAVAGSMWCGFFGVLL